MKKILMTLAAVFVCISAAAQASPDKHTLAAAASTQNTAAEKKLATAARLRAALRDVPSARDSVKVLYDIFDIVPRQNQLDVARELYAVAVRAGDNHTRLDICRQLSSILNSDKAFAAIEAEIKRIPKSREQKESMLFIKMKRIVQAAKFQSEEERQKEVTRILSEFDTTRQASDEKRLLDLFTVVEYLRNDASGDLLKKYLDRLTAMVSGSGFSLYALPNLIYAEAANIYADASDYRKSIEADRKLLEVISGLEQKYKAMGRNYRNYDVSRYIVYRRMMRNYKGLSQTEIADLHARVAELAARNPDVKADLEGKPRFMAYYLMARHDYNGAIPYLQRMLESEKALAIRLQLLDMLIEAAEKTGDDKIKIEALSEHNAILEELNALRASEKYRELQIKYDLKDLSSRNDSLELENRNQEIETTRRIMSLVIVAFVLMLAVIVICLFYWSKFQKNSRNMGMIADNVAEERNRLRRSIYYDYADNDKYGDDGDVAASWQKEMKKRHKHQFEVSTFLTENIINDIIYISAVCGNDRQKFIQSNSVDTLMREAAAKVSGIDPQHDRFEIQYPDKDFRIITDRDCVITLLAKMLTVASENCRPGEKIGLTCLPPVKGKVRFCFNTPRRVFGEADDPRVFDSLIDSDRMLASKSNGLYICRLISLLVNCDFRQDKSWTDGSRFVFSLPADLSVTNC